MKNPRRLSSRLRLIIAVVLFAFIGSTAYYLTRAATLPISIQPDKGTVASPATVIADNSASGSSAVKFAQPPSPPSSQAMWIGAAQNIPNTSVSAFLETSRIMGPLTVRRSFTGPVANIPTTKPAVMSGDLAAGLLSFYSIKVSGGPAQILNGSQDSNLRALFNSMPRDRPTWFTMWHEPENDINSRSFSSQQFRDMIARIWDVKQSSNNAANVKVGYVAMSYWWRKGTTFANNGNQMLPPGGKYDYLAVDDYNPATTSGRTDLSNDPAFLNWYNWAKDKGKPLIVAEFGRKQNPNDPNARAREFIASETFLREKGFQMFLYWNGSGEQGDWKLYDTPSINAWKQISSRGKSL